MSGELSHRRVGELTHKLFEILMTRPGGMARGEALGRLEAAVPLTPHETGIYESTGERRFEQIVSFATSVCGQAGWMQKSKGMWRVTEKGAAAWRKYADPEVFSRQALRLKKSNRANLRRALHRASARHDLPGEAAVDAPSAASSVSQARALAWREIGAHLALIGSYTFQDMVAALLRAMEWHVVFEAAPGPDGGIDIVARRDPLGSVGPRLKVQVKHGTTRIGPEVLRAFSALLRGGDLGVFIATGGFTRDAEELARLHADQLTLIDLARFLELWAEHEARLDVRARARLPLTRVLFLAPSVGAAPMGAEKIGGTGEAGKIAPAEPHLTLPR